MKKFISLLTCLLISSANAAVITVENQNQNVGNCIPFGCAGSYGPYMTNVYKDIDSFSLNTGDTIAFDLSGTNNVDIIFDIYMASTGSNGSNTADSNGFTQVVSAGNGGKGTSTQGDYELLYTIDKTWDFLGGGLMLAFSPVGITASDTSWSTGFYGNYSTGGSHVGQYYNGSSAGTGSYRNSVIPNFQITTNTASASASSASVPEPTSIMLIGLGLTGICLSRKKIST